ncbi:MAG: NADP-dependent oxidoreductase [Actinomycetes bacterium]
MRAISYDAYGDSSVLHLGDLPDPKVGPDYVLVRVRAAGINPVDWKVREGYLDGGFEVHFPVIPGWDVAGVVEQVGPSVREWAPGDEVIGYVRRDDIGEGTFAELVSAPVRTLGPKPASASWEQAAGLPLVGLTALQALRVTGTSANDVVLVHGASGGVGHVAVQIARILGARVIGTSSPANADFVRSLGAEWTAYGDGLVDRVRELAPDGVDVALDLAGGDALAASFELVSEAWRVASITDAAGVLERGGAYVFVRPDADQLAELAGWVDAGQLTVAIDRVLPLEQAAEAMDHVRDAHGRGKTVLRVSEG